jgi:MFS family permease
MREGFDYLAHHRGLRANTLLTVAGVAGIGAAYPLTFLLAVEVFDGTRSFGFMEAAIGAGYLIGSMGLVALAQRVRKGLAMTIGMAVMGGGLCVIASLSNLVPVLVAFAVVGVANAIVLIAIDTYLQEAIPAELRGRVLGLRFTITQGVYAVGVLAAGALAATVALDWLFLAVGLIVAVPALVGLLTPSVSDV